MYSLTGNGNTASGLATWACLQEVLLNTHICRCKGLASSHERENSADLSVKWTRVHLSFLDFSQTTYSEIIAHNHTGNSNTVSGSVTSLFELVWRNTFTSLSAQEPAQHMEDRVARTVAKTVQHARPHLPIPIATTTPDSSQTTSLHVQPHRKWKHCQA